MPFCSSSVESFDNKLFGISTSEAECLDLQQKLLLECTYTALESAGVPAEDQASSLVERTINKNKQNNSKFSQAYPD